MGIGSNGRLRFGDYELDSRSEKLFRDGRPVRIQPQPLRVLGVLLERPGEIVSRELLRTRVWGDATFVEFDQGLNYSIRQIRLALRDEVSDPRYIETLPKQGYRFIASVVGADGEPPAEPILAEKPAETLPRGRSWSAWHFAAGACVLLAIGGIAVYRSLRLPTALVRYTQLTDFTDSAVAPALSPDGRMVAFIRGGTAFLSADQIYVKVLPTGEARRLTNDGRLKYGLSFSPDGSEIAYTVLERPSFATYTVSVLGGDSHLLLKNAAGLSWLDQHQLLFSQVRSGIHLGIVTGTVTRTGLREIYFPPHERGMAHYSYPSPDHQRALVVEMDEHGAWAPCRLISLTDHAAPKQIGPPGACTSAGWSPDGSWMYFTAAVDERSHLWRQRFPDGSPEQITFGPTEEDGVAMERDGRSIITSVGAHESAIWIHDTSGERPLSSEGEVVADQSPPTFRQDDKVLYYLLRHEPQGKGAELWRAVVESGKSEPVFPGVSMFAYDVSPDGKQVVYATSASGGRSQLWLASVDRSSPARRIGEAGETSPHFGPRGRILFEAVEGSSNYLEQMNPDGSGRSKVVPYPISEIQGISPGRRWVMAVVPIVPGGGGPAIMAIPVEGGPPRRVCFSYCVPAWSSSGKFLFIPVQAWSLTTTGRSLAIPVGQGESLPELPPEGIEPLAEPEVVPGSQSVSRADLIPGRDLSHFAYVNTTVHRNLYRITLP